MNKQNFIENFMIAYLAHKANDLGNLGQFRSLDIEEARLAAHNTYDIFFMSGGCQL